MHPNGREFEIVDVPGIGLIRVAYAGDTPLPIYLLQTKTAKKYSAYKFLSKDLDAAFHCLHELQSLPEKSNGVIEQSLSFYAVVTYAKCFVQAKGRTKLEYNIALKYCEESLKDLHYNIMDLRHKYVAHGEIGEYEVNPITLAWYLENDNLHYRISDNLTYRSSIRSLADDFIKLLIAVNKFVEETIASTLSLLHEEIALISPEELTTNSFFPNQDDIQYIQATGQPID